MSPDERGGEPDVSISASYTAKSIRFKEKTRARTRVDAKGDFDDLTVSEREGAPEDPEPGKLYKNVRGGKTVAARVRAPREGPK
jgi:hypothetical protein